jgi:hypothetical protein
MAVAGTASAGGGSATAFAPTLGLIDGSAFFEGVDDTSTLTTIVDGSSVLAGID